MLPPKRTERQPRASLLPGVLLCVILATVSASISAGVRCPQRIDCAQRGRHFCQAGTNHCGPCLTPLVENQEGQCVGRKKHHHRDKMTSFPDLEGEIDFLHSVIAKQEVTEVKQSVVTHSQAAPKTLTAASKQRVLAPPPAGQPPTTAAPHTNSTPQPATALFGRGEPITVPYPSKDSLLVIMISVCILVGTVALILAGVCWIRLQKESRLAQKVDYPAFGGGGTVPGAANGTSMGDKTLAQSAQMYHYQHQKQQMLSMGKHKAEQKVPDSEVTSDEEEVGGDFTVYECPGLAPTGEMEVKNPLFDDSTLHYQGNHK